MTEATAKRLGVDLDDLKQTVLAQIPRGVLGQPHHIARVLAFLASDDSEYVTGQTIYATGGPIT